MGFEGRTKKQLIEEIQVLRQRIEDLESEKRRETSGGHVVGGSFPEVSSVLSSLSLEQQKIFTMFSVEKAAEEVFWMNSDSRVLYVNQSACRRLGYTYDEMLDMHVWDWNPDLTKETWEVFWNTYSGEKSLVFETHHCTKNGHIFPVEITGHLFVYENQEFLFAFVKDLTERKNAEAEKAVLDANLRQAQKMEAIGALAGGVAHDFNNMLGVILGSVELARLNIPAGTVSSKYLDRILLAANRARSLVTQILAFSRQSKVERVPMRLQPVIEEASRMIRSTIPSTIRMEETLDPECGSVMADPTQVHQIFMNLCTNAYHSMKESGGTLSIQLSRKMLGDGQNEAISGLTPGEYVELTVQDTGEGIGPDLITRIFDPCFTTKEVGEGTGMGLAIVHGIMREYGGTITVASELGKGSVFRAFFPAATDATVMEDQESEDVERGCGRVLLVDDEPELAETARVMLHWLGYDVTVSCSSPEAYETFCENPDSFDIILTDQTMPELTGVELARRVKRIRPDIPIVLCTGYSNLIDEHSAQALGISEFVLKPLTISVVSKIMRRVLS